MSADELADRLQSSVLDLTRKRSLMFELWFVVTVLFSFLLFANQYLAYALSRLCVFIIATAGMTFAYRYFNLLSLGHAGFLAVGAYASALFALAYPPWSAFGPFVGGVAGYAFGVALYPVLRRVEGVAYSLVTLVAGTVIQTSATELVFVTGGAEGLLNIPHMRLVDYEFDQRLTLLFSILVLMFVLRGVREVDLSHIGRGMFFCGKLPDAASIHGFYPDKERGRTLLLSAWLCGLSGGMFGLLQGYLGPSSFGFDTSVELLAGSVVAGTCSPLALVSSGALFVLLPDWFAPASTWRLVCIGATLLIVQRFFPGGIGPLIEAWVRSLLASKPFRPLMTSVSMPMIVMPSWRTSSRATGSACNQPTTLNSESSDVQLDRLGLEINGAEILRGISVHLRSGVTYGLVGANGSGKTMLLNVLVGLQAHTSGRLTVLGKDYRGMRPQDAYEMGIRRTFQTPQLVAELAVLENISLGIDAKRGPGMFGRFLGIDRPAPVNFPENPVIGMLSEADLHTPIKRISTPHRRRTELLRALAFPGRILLADEPASGLTETDAQSIISALNAMKNHTGTVVVVEHTAHVIQQLCAELLILTHGLLVTCPADVMGVTARVDV